jgi:nucleoid DNA-binding protein
MILCWRLKLQAMDKPTSMSVKDYLIRIMSVKLMLSEKTIEAVVNHQFQSANVALVDNDSVEISGFGKFFFNKKKAQKKMDKMFSKAEVFTKQANDIGLSDQKRASANVKLNNTLLGIEALKPKLHVEHQSDLRGVEEQVDSFGEYEGTD